MGTGFICFQQVNSSDKWLPAETPWQALQPRQVSEALRPGTTPVYGSMGFGLARGAAGGIALGAARFFVGVGIAAGAAFDSVQLGARREVGAVMAASQMPGDLEVSDHVSVSFLMGVRAAKNQRRRVGRAGAINPEPSGL